MVRTRAVELLLLLPLALAGCAEVADDGPGTLPEIADIRHLAVTIEVPGDYPTIGDALAVSVPGDVVDVAAGVYVEDITIPGGVTVLGAGLDATAIEGQVTVSGGQAGLASLQVNGLGANVNTDCGISTGAGDSILIQSIRVSSWYAAVCFDPGPSIAVPWPLIDRASLQSNGYGVVVYSGEADVTNNYIVYGVRAGVWAFDGAVARVINNTLIGNSFGGNTSDRDAAISLGVGATGSVVRNNSVTSNFYGMQCDACDAQFSHNNVWGNTTNYAGDAGQESTDLNVDPQYVSVSDGNLRLQETSLLIDAGSAELAPDHDWDGLGRPSGPGFDIGADEWSLSSFTLGVNEIMANPTTEATGEFIEIANLGNDPVDVAGLIVSDGDSEDTLEGYLGGSTVIPGGGFGVVLDPGYANEYTIPGDATLLTVGNATLGNGLSNNDPISLLESNGYVVIDEFTLPFDAGNGNSIERVDVLSGNVNSNWVVSACPSGSSPGEVNCAAGEITPNDPSTLVITEVMANAVDETTSEYVELWNNSSADVDLAGLVIEDTNQNTGNTSDDVLIAFGGGDTVVPANGYALIVDPNYTLTYLVPGDTILVTTPDSTIGNGLGNSNDAVTLYDTDGTTVIDSYSYPADYGDGISVEKVDYLAGDDSANWAPSTCPIGHSAARLSCNAGGVGDGIAINEVMNNPLSETTGEFIELKNIGPGSVDLLGLGITDGDQVDELISYDGGPTVLNPGEYALIVDSGHDGDFTIPTGMVTLTTADSHLGNGLSLSDPITLLETDLESTVDTWVLPFNPGNGTSVEKINALTGDSEDNWAASTCTLGHSAGLENCVSYVPIPGGTTELYLSEVMANPLDEATGEYIEVYNYGSTPIDLWGLIVYDGDAWDFIREFDFGSTIVDPGEYAVIVDLQYAYQYAIPTDVTLVTVDDGALGSGLAASNDPVYIYEADGYSVIDSYTFPFNPGNGTSVSRQVLEDGDVEGNWAEDACGSSPGEVNCIAE